MSEGTEMNIIDENGKSQFVDNLFAWAKSFHNGRKFCVNIARVAIRYFKSPGKKYSGRSRRECTKIGQDFKKRPRF